MASTVLPFPGRAPSQAEMRGKIRELVEAGNVEFKKHLFDRMAEHDISLDQVLDVLRNGHPVNKPHLDEYGDWNMQMQKLTGSQRVYVDVAIDEGVLVITTWK